MTTTYDLGSALIAKLQHYAIPYVDQTPVDTMARILEEYEILKSGDKPETPAGIDSPVQCASQSAGHHRLLNVDQPPNLLHTRVRGRIGDREFSKWNELVRAAHEMAYPIAGSFAALTRASHAQLREGQHSDCGFHFLPTIGISVQGVDADHAWEYSLQLARFMSIPIEATVQWRNNPKAAHPGETAVLMWNHTQN